MANELYQFLRVVEQVVLPRVFIQLELLALVVEVLSIVHFFEQLAHRGPYVGVKVGRDPVGREKRGELKRHQRLELLGQL